MFCTKCGTENEDGAKFCTGCGQMLQEEKQTTDMTPNVKPERVKKNMTKTVNLKGIVGVGVIIVLLIVVLGIVTNLRRTINLNKYLTIETSGYDGYGKVTAKINWSEINDKYGSKVKFTSRAKKEVGDFLDMVTPMDIIQESVHVVVKNDEDISNGDVITYTWSVDSNLSQYVKCKIKYKEDTHEVSGLEEIEEFDPFEDLEVTFSGMAPNGSVNLNYVGDELSAYDFHSDSVNGLSNGDTITVSIEDGRAEYCIKEYGKMPEKMEAKYEVQGLDSYVMSFSEIDGATLEEMQKQASDVFYAEVAREWDEEKEKVESFEYIGNYYLTAKNSDIWGTQNGLFLIYKVQVHNTYTNDYREETYDQSNEYYWYIEYNNLIVKNDGKIIVDVSDYGTTGEKFWIDSNVNLYSWGSSTYQWYYYGYQTLDGLYKDVVTENIDTYNCEENI